MDINDIFQLSAHTPGIRKSIVHLAAVNHSQETRADIRTALQTRKLDAEVFVPEDGAFIEL